MRDRAVVEERLWAKVASRAPGECWPWIGGTVRGGYGHMVMPGLARQLMAHRISYELAYGPIPKGLVLDHLCKNTACVNPDHLEPVTIRENTLRGISPTALNAAKTHCKRGHEFDADNTVTRPNGNRMCLPCKRMLDRRNRQKVFICPVCNKKRAFSSRMRHLRTHEKAPAA